MFYKLENNQLIQHPNSPTEFGAHTGIIPTPEQIEMFAGYEWFDTEQDAKDAFGLAEN